MSKGGGENGFSRSLKFSSILKEKETAILS
jgi:hypothetical protein